MAGIVGQGTTFNLPNFVGELYGISTEDTPLLAAIGGLTGGKQVNDKRFEWSFYDLRAAEDTRQRVEGANAPSPEERVRSNAFNVVEIHQEAVEISYTKLAATGARDALVRSGDTNNVSDEMDWQVEASLKQIARDIEKTFITGTFADPATNATARRTRGLIEAITTNVTVAGGLALTETMVLNTMEAAWNSGGLQEGETRTVLVGSAAKRYLTKLFVTNKGYTEATRNVGGVNLQTIETDFGLLNVMLDRYVPAGTIIFASLEDLAPVHLLIPGKGFLFVEPLAKVGAAERSQIYGEVGLEYGNEMKHAKLTGFIAPA
jgi:hypothetical protein